MITRTTLSLTERLEAHPQLQKRFSQILDIVENTDGDVELADDAEERVIEELRRLGNEVLHDWANGQETKKSEELTQSNESVRKEIKKNSLGTQRMEI